MQPLSFKTALFLFCLAFLQARPQHNIATFTKEDGLTSVQVTTNLVDSKGIVWFGTTNGINAFVGDQWVPIKGIEQNNSGSTISLGSVNSIFEDLDANIWVSTSQGLFNYNRNYWTFFEPFDDMDYLPGTFLQDRGGGVWITMEKFQNLDDEMGFSLTSGKVQFYKDQLWFTFKGNLAGTAAVKGRNAVNYFSKIFQDTKGRIWFATLEGVYMYDGYDWESFKEDELDAKKVYDLIESSRGEYWAATEHGVSRKVENEWINYSKKDGLSENHVFKIIEDQHGKIWAFSRNDMRFTGLSVFHDGKWDSFNTGQTDLKGEIEELIFFNEEVMAFGKSGVSLFNGVSWKKTSKKQGLVDKNYSVIKKDRAGKLWLAGDQGFYSYSDNQWNLLLWQDEKWSVKIIFRDRKNRIWVGTEKSGIYVYNGYQWDSFNQETGLSDNFISTVFDDRHGNIWIVTKKGISMITNDLLSN